MFSGNQSVKSWFGDIVLAFCIGLMPFIAWQIINQTVTTSDIEQQKLEKEAQIQLLEQQNQRQKLENQFLASDYYVDLAIRRQQGYTLEDENLYVIGHDKIQRLKKIYQPPQTAEKTQIDQVEQSNLDAWFDFLFGES
ncbi:MAG: septum formation initiator family protein [Candidatus Saccharibacteria bacterium]|nr:septum formation initiator family protein [Candidatus Saccharibacteria bacterium]MCY4011013.1 septum formation initiator family protein [Candidatus Saccharibacteria bacterium]